MFPSEKIMFEIYREAGYARQFRVVYFTELDEHNKEREIARAMSGEHVCDGFLKERDREEGKRAIAGIVDELNSGVSLDEEAVGARLARFLVE